MKIKTRITALLLAVTMAVTVAGCGKKTDVTQPVNQDSVIENITSEVTETPVVEATTAPTETPEPTEALALTEAQKAQNLQNLLQFYSYWKERYVVKDEYVTYEDQYYVWYVDERYEGGTTSVPVTVSEAHGYGMLTMVMMNEYDDEAQELFDGMVRYYNEHRSDIGPSLMSWQQCDNGDSLIDGADDGQMEEGRCDSATDGDMDIAYALLCADKVWGSDGEFDYKTLAVNMINDIMTYEISQDTFLPTLGDWCYGISEESDYYNATRSSDFIMPHFPAFYEATGDVRWNYVYENAYALINQAVEEYETGLLPDFWVWDSETGAYSPAYSYFLENVSDGYYGYNSCRVPWRIGADYLLNGNETAKKFAETINTFIYESTRGRTNKIVAGYKLDGTSVARYNDLCFTAPFLITAKCCDNVAWEETLRTSIVSTGRDVYFGDSIKMLVLLIYNDIYMVP